MSTPEERGARINVSEDKLDAKLARLELSLVDRITKALDVKADQAYVEQLHARIHTVEGTLQATALLAAESAKTSGDVEERLRGLERFRHAIPSVSLVAALAAVGETLYLIFHHHS